MNDEISRDPGAGNPAGGSADHSDGPEGESAGWSDASGGSRADDRRRRDSQDRIKWAGVTASIVTIAIILVQMFGVLDNNHENSEINKDRTAKIIDLGTQLADELDNLQEQVNTIPTEVPTPPPTTVVVKGEPGEPGQPGQPGKVVTAPPKTVIVEKPGPTKTVTPSPQPTCRTSLLGTCVAP